MPTLLVADDSVFQRFMIAKIVREVGFAVKEAKTGKEALDIILSGSVDGVLLDLNMPDLSGLGVLQEMQAHGSRIPVIIISADIQNTTRERCTVYGIAHILNKPFDPVDLRIKLKGMFP